jgi:hypothetical protein
MAHHDIRMSIEKAGIYDLNAGRWVIEPHYHRIILVNDFYICFYSKRFAYNWRDTYDLYDATFHLRNEAVKLKISSYSNPVLEFVFGFPESLFVFQENTENSGIAHHTLAKISMGDKTLFFDLDTGLWRE